jgi:hypothetical protein
MKGISFEALASGSLRALKRFPFVMLVATIAAFSAVYFADLSFEDEKTYPYLTNIMFVGARGISLMFALALLTEKLNLRAGISIPIQLGGLALLVLYVFLLPENFPEGPLSDVIRYFLFVLASHLLVSFIAFLQAGGVDHFWQFNKNLLLRFVLSGLYSGVLFAGLAIALLAINVLMEVKIEEVRYLQLFLLIGFVFNTGFFLAGVPDGVGEEMEIEAYPKALKVFVQYLLLPLVSVYILILYSYMFKIIIQWDWPTGWVANLVLSFSIAGIFSILLLHPIKDHTESKWVRTFSRGFYYSLIPLVVLLLLAIYRRISEYGVTENRFFVATLAVWLALVVAYFILSKDKNIKVIPISLFLFVILCTTGPFSAFSVSKRNQVHRLTEYLEKNNIWNGSDLNTDVREIPFDDRKNMSSIVEYLVNTHGTSSLQMYFEEPVDSLIAEDATSETAGVLSLMGLNYVSPYATTEDLLTVGIFYYKSSQADEPLISTDGYDWHLRLYSFSENSRPAEFKINEDEYSFSLLETGRIRMNRNDEKLIEMNLTAFAVSLSNEFRNSMDAVNPGLDEKVLDPQRLELGAFNDEIDLRFRFREIYLEEIDGELHVNNFTADVLFNLKE